MKYIIRQPKVAAGKTPLIILLHGVGSNENALFSFAGQLPDQFLVISVRAPLVLGANSFGWYQVDFSTGKPVFNKAQEAQSRQMLIDFIGQLKRQFDFDEQQVYLCGFSQGAIMSYSVALTRPDLVKGIAVMSGRLLEEIKPLVAPKEKLHQLKIFIAHGTNDNMLSVQYAKDAVAFLKTLGLNPTFNEYDAGHQANAEMLGDLIKWLK